MRNCPVCSSDKRKLLWRSDYIVPDGWTRPGYLDWVKCECGMIYGDHPTATQEDYDTYYKERYGYGVTDSESLARLQSRADYLRKIYPRDNARIMDFGGGDGALAAMLRNAGYSNVITYNVGDDMPTRLDAVFMEHVIEHIYDLDVVMARIVGALKERGILIVDCPDAGRIAFERNPKTPILDYSQVHINHFQQADMLRLMRRYGLELYKSEGYTERNSACRMYVFIKDTDSVGRLSRWYVTKNIGEKVAKLRALGDEPVCVWGYGDIAAECLAGWFPNVKYFVCNDPAFEGTTIKGLPVYKSPIDNLPIVVIAQSQKEKLLAHIKEVCENEVIAI